MTTIPGYELLMRSSEASSQELAEQMSFAGIPVTLTRDGDAFCLFVPESFGTRSRLFLEEYFNASSDARKDENRKIFEADFLKPAPGFISAAEKLKNRSSTANLFIGAAACLFIEAFIFGLKGNRPQFFAYLLMALFFMIFGLHTRRKVRELREKLAEELAFSRTVTDWFFRTYSTEDLDRMVLSMNMSPLPEEMDLLRRDMIRDYISREFSFRDTSYLEYLTDEIYSVFYP